MGFVNTTPTDTLMRMFQAGTLKLDSLITHGKVGQLCCRAAVNM